MSQQYQDDCLRSVGRDNVLSTPPTTTRLPFPGPSPAVATDKQNFATIQQSFPSMQHMATREQDFHHSVPPNTTHQMSSHSAHVPSPVQQTFPHPVPLANTYQQNCTYPTTPLETIQQDWSHTLPPMGTREQKSPYPIPPTTSYPPNVRQPSSSVDANQQNCSRATHFSTNQENFPYLVPPNTTRQISPQSTVLQPLQQNPRHYVPLATAYQNYTSPTSPPETIPQGWPHTWTSMEAYEKDSSYSMPPTTTNPYGFRPPTSSVETNQRNCYHDHAMHPMTNQQAPTYSVHTTPTHVLHPPQQNPQQNRQQNPQQNPQDHTVPAYQQSYQCQTYFPYSEPPATLYQQSFVYSTSGRQLPVMPHQHNYFPSVPLATTYQPVPHPMPVIPSLEKSQDLYFEEMPQYADAIFGGGLSARGTQPVWLDQWLDQWEEVKTEEREFYHESELYFEEEIKHLRSMIGIFQALLIVTEFRLPDAKKQINWCHQEIRELKETIQGNPRYSHLEELIWDRSEERGKFITKDDLEEYATTLQTWCLIDVARIVTQYLPSEENLLRALEIQFREFETYGTDQKKVEYGVILTEICKTNDRNFERAAIDMICWHFAIAPHIFRKRTHCWRSVCILAMKWGYQLLENPVLIFLLKDETSELTFKLIQVMRKNDSRGCGWKRFMFYVAAAHAILNDNRFPFRNFKLAYY